MAEHHLKTERLVGRPITLTDFGRLRSIHSHSRAAATLSVNGQPFSKAHTRRTLATWSEHWTANGFGVWLFHQTDGEFVGYAGIMRTTVENTPELELLYALRPEFWGKDYATEISQAALRFAFQQAGVRDIVAYTLPTNVASRRVMEKCGFSYERDIVHAGLPHVLYRIHDAAAAQSH